MQDFSGQTHKLFEITEKLADEGLYTVYKAIVHRHIPILVTLKIFPKEFSAYGEFAHRFDRVGQDLMKLEHEHILYVGDYGEIEGHKFLATRFYEGQTLRETLRVGQLELPFVRNVISQVGDALHYAHESGFIHRDINPNHIWLHQSGRAWLTNFEIALLHAIIAKSEQEGPLLGNPLYYSPEQCLGEELDGRSDIFSLGLVLYEMVTGSRPFEGVSPVQIIMKKIKEDPPSPRDFKPEISEELEAVILKSIAKERDDRYQTAAEMAAAVEGAIPE